MPLNASLFPELDEGRFLTSDDVCFFVDIEDDWVIVWIQSYMWMPHNVGK